MSEYTDDEKSLALALVAAGWPCSHEGVGSGECTDCEVQKTLSRALRNAWLQISRKDASLRASEEKVAALALEYQAMADKPDSMRGYCCSIADELARKSLAETVADDLRSLISNPALLQLAEAKDRMIEDARKMKASAYDEQEMRAFEKSLSAYDAALKAVTEKR